MKQKQTAHVLSQREIAPDIYDMWIETSLAAEAKPGQFVGVYPKDKSTLLPRPISICEISRKTDANIAAAGGEKENGNPAERNAVYPAETDALRIVYRIAGAGTKEFSTYCAGEPIELLGTLGNGFPLFPVGGTEKGAGKKVFLMGGGIGIPPILELARQLDTGKAEKQIILGYRDGALFLKEDFERYGTVYVATEDGSVGTKGNVMDAIRENGLEADVIYACGPMPMLRAIKKYAAEHRIPAYISLEEHMACGVGACLGCVVKTKEIDHHSHVNNARICTDGPVFEAGEVDI
ncbi:MAG TPA: dihydroorotate dehydrogenase electron transfer subunit [Lachnospiraceae bacterium]|nr:dihydroorotate dehydrogenase electron transfer subunit [Lachnospiraceae bacterium]